MITCQHFEHYVQANPEMFFLFDRVIGELTDQYGQPMVPYKLRPGQDGRRVWTSFTDASRADVKSFPGAVPNDNVKFGAGGGWFRLWESDTVFFFTRQWPDEQVAACNIGELEMMTSIMCSVVCVSATSRRPATALPFCQDRLASVCQFGLVTV
eukprot:COSAG06_NODE_10441_length_1680_cov_4.487666_1_plen_154_part_00